MRGYRKNNSSIGLQELFREVHRLATGRELSVTEAMNYFGDPKRLASVVERSGILSDPARRRRLETMLSESRNGI